MAATKKKTTQSEHEDQFLNQVRGARLPLPDTQLQFHDSRKWAFDFAWPNWMLAVEIHGGTYVGGRHTRGKGFKLDREKMAEAVLDGWTVLEFTTGQVSDGTAIGYVTRWFDRFGEG